MDRQEAVKKLQKRYSYNNQYIRENYDRIALTLPRGTKERLAKTGQKTNTLIRELILNYLDENGL